jgi:hypothetical protein
MSTTDWPARITPAAAQWQLQKAGTQFASPFNGTVQAVDYVAERWAVSLSLPNQLNPGAVAALLNNLAGGVNRVNLWHHGSGGQPAGTLRGTPRLAAGAARGYATLSLSNCTSPANAILGGGFSIDSNGDGRGDYWDTYSAGATGIVAYNLLGGGIISGPPQQVTATALGTASGDRIGISQDFACASLAGAPCVASAYTFGTAGASAKMVVTFYTSAAVYCGGFAEASAVIGGSVARLQTAGIVPANAATAKVWIWMTQMPVAGAAEVRIDSVIFAAGTVAGDFPPPATLLAGDMIGCSGHLLQVASDCQATDAGVMTVPIINRVRATIASGTAVTWYRPTAQFMMPAMAAGALQVPCYTQGAALDLLEVW